MFSSDFALDPARMNPLDLSDGIFHKEVPRTEWIADALNAAQGVTGPAA